MRALVAPAPPQRCDPRFGRPSPSILTRGNDRSSLIFRPQTPAAVHLTTSPPNDYPPKEGHSRHDFCRFLVARGLEKRAGRARRSAIGRASHPGRSGLSLNPLFWGFVDCRRSHETPPAPPSTAASLSQWGTFPHVGHVSNVPLQLCPEKGTVPFRSWPLALRIHACRGTVPFSGQSVPLPTHLAGQTSASVRSKGAAKAGINGRLSQRPYLSPARSPFKIGFPVTQVAFDAAYGWSFD